MIHPNEATALFEQCRGHNLWVRTRQKDSSPHRGRARLLGLDGETAIIQPENHKRTERVPLQTLTWWHAMNERFKNGNGNGHAPRFEEVEPDERWVIVAPDVRLFWAKGFWTPKLSVTLTRAEAVYETATGAARARGGLRSRADWRHLLDPDQIDFIKVFEAVKLEAKWNAERIVEEAAPPPAPEPPPAAPPALPTLDLAGLPPLPLNSLLTSEKLTAAFREVQRSVSEVMGYRELFIAAHAEYEAKHKAFVVALAEELSKQIAPAPV